jgi:hypothetical protein
MTVYEASTWVIPVIIAITFHEAAHGFVALLFGDGTAWRLGRVSFNPLRHIDHVWSIRTKLQVEGRTRDLAMFNLAIDSKLRGCDVRGQCLWIPQPRLRLRADRNLYQGG